MSSLVPSQPNLMMLMRKRHQSCSAKTSDRKGKNANDVSCKGPHDTRALDVVVGHVMQFGFILTSILRVDSENAAKSLRDIDAAKLKENHVRVAVQSPPPYDSASIGFLGRQIKEKTRVLVCAARELHGVVVETSYVCLLWASQCAGRLIMRQYGGRECFCRGSVPRCLE